MENNALKELLKYRIDRAEENLAAAKEATEKQRIYVAVRDLYYAMFQMVLAILLTQNIKAKTHKSIILKFSEAFILTGIFDKKFGRILNSLYSLRQDADYTDFTIIEPELINEYISEVKQFLSETKEYLDKWIEQQNETTKTK